MVLFRTKVSSIIIILFWYSKSLTAQPQIINYNEIKAKYKNQHALFLKNEEAFHCRISNGKLDLSSDNLLQVLYLDNKLTNYSEQSVAYAPGFYAIRSLEASAYVPDGLKYKQNKVTAFKDIDYTKGESFYDGIRAKKFYFQGIDEKVITEIKFSYLFTEPSTLGVFYFKREIPCLQSVYTITVEKGIEIGYKLFGDTAGISFSQTNQGDKTIYRWELINAKEIKHFDDEVNIRYNEPHLYVYIKSYTIKKKKELLFDNVADLYKHEFKYIEHLNSTPPLPALVAVVDSIKSVSSTQSAVAKGVFNWVQHNLKYVAFEDGYGAQIPREANDVFDKKFGDCKDLSSIITRMLTIANIPSYMVWIGTRELPYTFQDLPLGYSCNHMIAATYLNGEWIFLDGTSKHTPFGVPSSFIQGKEGLISISPDSFVVVKIPVMPPSFNSSAVSINMDLDMNKQSIAGKGYYKLEGYNHASWAGSLYYAGSNKVETRMKDFLTMGNNKFTVDTLQYHSLFNNDSPLTINFGFTLPNYIKMIDDDIFVNMHLRKTFAGFRIDTTGNRMISKDLSYTWVDTYHACLTIPKGYAVKKIPANLVYNGERLSYSFVYTVKDGCICMNKESRYTDLEVKAKDFNEWNTQIDKILKSYNDLIILSKK